ncbi:MAG TPA: hypothetical protein VNM69_05015 [Bacillus sp. (in: firmicutes)]|uniref:hypothetical protein n=1 Tax=Bacillus litorisediminis TaxID=2922713 RepID=UPI001FAD350F|nr:hypothetical protein [Bacillus litorisediminis]HWO75267.1 hypothetical protein [Bacillus sp. (in: firmicutes)]
MATHLGLHETLEAHELLVFKNLSLTKSVTMKSFVQDEELKALLVNDVYSGTKFINRLQEILKNRS